MHKHVVLITGVSSGIGEQTARMLCVAGYTVYGVARRIDRLRPLDEIGVNIIPADLCKAGSMSRCVEQIIRREGRIDVLVNNAGYGAYGAIEEVSTAQAKRQMEVSLFAPARLIQLVLPHMRQNHRGKIINITSASGMAATPLSGWYHAGCCALEALSDSLRMEVRPFGIDVVVVRPGMVRTQWADVAGSHLEKTARRTSYPHLHERSHKLFEANGQATDPTEIARLIKHIVESGNLKPRYAKGHMANEIITAKKRLDDRKFEKTVLRHLELTEW